MDTPLSIQTMSLDLCPFTAHAKLIALGCHTAQKVQKTCILQVNDMKSNNPLLINLFMTNPRQPVCQNHMQRRHFYTSTKFTAFIYYYLNTRIVQHIYLI